MQGFVVIASTGNGLNWRKKGSVGVIIASTKERKETIFNLHVTVSRKKERSKGWQKRYFFWLCVI